jgi:Icc-related predicted phosphoesterase
MLYKFNKKSLQIVSDLHLESKYNRQHFKHLNQMINPCGDYLALLGDIGNIKYNHLKLFLQQANDHYEKVFYILGNHEYMHPLPNKILDMTKEICYDMKNIIILQNDVYYLNDYKIIGTTLFCQTNNDNEYKQKMNSENIKSIQFIKQNLNHDKIIVMTHYLPSYQLIDYEYKNCAHYYANHLDDLLGHPIKYWLCGHIHQQKDMVINGTRCIINPCGDLQCHDKNKIIILE